MTTKSTILDQQRAWADRRGIPVDPYGYVQSPQDNLFQPISESAALAFQAGGGSEMLQRGERGAKMSALHSSAALAVNVFDYWTQQSNAPLVAALGLKEGAHKMQFEAQFPTGLGGTPPNLDIAFTSDTGRVIGIESKFTEWLTPKSPSKELFKAKYFSEGALRWASLGLPKCQSLAEDMRDGVIHFRYLDAAQLLKHALGMATNASSGASLYYLFFDATGREAAVHRAEIEQFTSRVGAELSFRAVSYQALFERLDRAIAVEHQSYVNYLRERYLSSSAET